MSEHEAKLLEFSLDPFRRLPCCGKLDGVEDHPGFALEQCVRGVEEMRVEFWGDAAEKERLYMNRPEAGGPGKAFQAPRDVGGVDELAATITREKRERRHGRKA
ncbi:MAG: hypothetical protein WBR26_21355 [Candidatus Acidiferrum sp.]